LKREVREEWKREEEDEEGERVVQERRGRAKKKR